jgi:hypothetical protein
MFYNISRNELPIFWKIFTKLLNKGFIRVNFSPAVVLVLFAKKTRGKFIFLRGVLGTKSINKKNCYFLPFIHEILRNIIKTK